MAETIRKVPKDAFRLDCGPLQFAEVKEEGATSNRISMIARTPDPIDHWYWGRIVHDMSGMQLRKDRAPIDWCHWESEILGYLDEFKADKKTGLTVAGELVPFKEDDRATEILHKGRAGVPYEASIDFCGPKLVEEVGEGITVEVNGYKFTGPGYVVRKWTLNAVAICPYGADSGTRTQFSKRETEAEEVDVCIFQQEAIMPDDNKPADNPPVDPQQLTEPVNPPPTAPATKPADPPADPRAAFTAELKRYTDKFGAEKGAEWFAAGKSWEEALDLQIALQKEQLTGKDSQIQELNTKLSAAEALRGEAAPATFDDKSGSGDKANKFSTVLSPGTAAFAAGIKLPTAKK